jgi:dienelactone hydrolase
MSSKILSSKTISELQPNTELDAIAHEGFKYPFVATTPEDALLWKTQCRAALGEAIGFMDTPVVSPDPEIIEEVDKGDYIRRKIVIRTSEYALMPVYLLIPKDIKGSAPVAIAYAGHGYGVKDIVGLWENGDERDTADGYHDDFGVKLCRRGFLVAAPEIACFGERQNDYSYLNEGVPGPVPTTCHNASTYAFMLGTSILGMRVRDGMRLIDYLQTIAEADSSRIGVMGISGGGMLTFYHTAMDPRIGACVVSGYYSSLRSSVLAMNHCTCNFAPGLYRIGEHTDIAGLILPRPMLIEAATHDEIFPIAVVRKSVEKAREICKILGGNPDSDVELDEFEARHRISGRRSYDFLWEKLS